MGALRFFLRFILGTLILLGLGLVAVWVFREPLTQWVIADGLRRAGYEDARFEVSALSSTQLQLQNVTMGTGDNGTAPLSVEQINIGYNWRTLLSEKRIKTLVIGPGLVRATLAEEGALKVPGLVLPGAASTPASRSAFDPANLPLDAITILPIEINFKTPRGPAKGVLQGDYDRKKGGRISAQLQSDAAGIESLFVAPAQGDFEIDLEPDGNFFAKGDITGGVETDYGSIKDIALTVEGRGASWISIIDQGTDGLSMQGIVDLQSLGFAMQADTPTSESVRSSVDNLNAIVSAGEPMADVGAIALSGALRLTLEDGVLSAFPVDNRPIEMRTDSGDQLHLSGFGERPLFTQKDNIRQFSFATSIQSRWLSMIGQISADQIEADQIRISGSVMLPAQTLDLFGGEGRTQIGTLGIEFTGNQTGDRYFALATMNGEIKAIDRVPLNIRGLRFDRDTLAISFLPNAPAGIAPLTITGAPSQGAANKPCLDVGEVFVSLGPEDLNTTLSGIDVCINGQPLLEVSTLVPLRARIHANARADKISYRHGDATLLGRPPRTDLNARWDSEREQLTLSGNFSGGNAVLNQNIRLSKTSGIIRAQIIAEQLSAQANLSQILIEQASRPVMIAPMLASGGLTYTDNRANFKADVTTVDLVTLGTVNGTHDLSSGSGAMSVSFAPLTFLPDGLQPVQILPSLAGIIADATGTVTGSADFDWSTDASDKENPFALGSSATLIANDLTFAGPGRAVSATGGVNGTVHFVDLLPAKSKGVQTIELGFVDLDAIRLENGLMRIEFPGDDTVRVIEGEFPWFDGTLGAYDTVADLTGERVSTALKASDINLGAFLAFLNIPGLDGEGTIAGTLPIIIDDGKIRVEDGVLRATTPGVIRFDSEVTRELAKTSQETQLAFDVLRELTFDTFEATISGALDGQLRVGLVFEGINAITIGKDRVPAPVIYRITLEGPLPNLLSQRMQFSNFSFTPTPESQP